MRELREFLSIPNVANDRPNIEKMRSPQRMLEARGIETHLLSIEGRGPVVFGKLETETARRTVIFYRPLRRAVSRPFVRGNRQVSFEPALRDKSIEAGGKRIPYPDAASGRHILPGRLAHLRPLCLRRQNPPSTPSSPPSTDSTRKIFRCP